MGARSVIFVYHNPTVGQGAALGALGGALLGNVIGAAAGGGMAERLVTIEGASQGGKESNGGISRPPQPGGGTSGSGSGSKGSAHRPPITASP
jgi:hypothetical protein